MEEKIEKNRVLLKIGQSEKWQFVPKIHTGDRVNGRVCTKSQ